MRRPRYGLAAATALVLMLIGAAPTFGQEGLRGMDRVLAPPAAHTSTGVVTVATPDALQSYVVQTTVTPNGTAYMTVTAVPEAPSLTSVFAGIRSIRAYNKERLALKKAQKAEAKRQREAARDQQRE